MKLWNHASVRTTHGQVAGLVVNSVRYPTAKGGLAGGAEPLKGGWGRAEPHLSRTLEKEQAAQAKGCQGWSPSSGHSGFSPPHPHLCPDFTQGQSLTPRRVRCRSVLCRGWRGGWDRPGPGLLSLAMRRSRTDSCKAVSAHETHCRVLGTFESRAF